MKIETKLRLQKWALMALRSIVWHVDEWLHRQEVAYRDSVAGQHPSVQRIDGADARGHASPARPDEQSTPTLPREVTATRPSRRRETFAQWEARRSGIAAVSKKEARRRRGMPVREFDLRFAR